MSPPSLATILPRRLQAALSCPLTGLSRPAPLPWACVHLLCHRHRSPPLRAPLTSSSVWARYRALPQVSAADCHSAAPIGIQNVPRQPAAQLVALTTRQPAVPVATLPQPNPRLCHHNALPKRAILPMAGYCCKTCHLTHGWVRR